MFETCAQCHLVGGFSKPRGHICNVGTGGPSALHQIFNFVEFLSHSSKQPQEYPNWVLIFCVFFDKITNID
jgi:hypothetical protein